MNHFNPKIASWAAVNHLSSLTEEQVLEVVKSNYDTLTLKLHDTLDQYERYSEKPKESAFFTQTVSASKIITVEHAHHLCVHPLGSKRTRYLMREPDLCANWFKMSVSP